MKGRIQSDRCSSVRHRIAAAVCSVAMLGACNQASPSTDDDADDTPNADDVKPSGDSDGGAQGPTVPAGDSGPTDVVLENVDEYFPLVDGASWTYRHTHRTNGQWEELVTMTSDTYDGQQAWIIDDSPDLNDQTTRQFWQWVGTAVSRVHREQRRNENLVLLVDYDPGFLRFDSTWDRVGAGGLNEYQRDEQNVDGTNDTSTRQQQHEVLSVNDTVQVPAGTFVDCILVERTRLDTGSVSHFWFARGVGKVKEEDAETLTLEELIEFDIP